MKDFLIITTIAAGATLLIYAVSFTLVGTAVPWQNIYIAALLGALFAHTTA